MLTTKRVSFVNRNFYTGEQLVQRTIIRRRAIRRAAARRRSESGRLDRAALPTERPAEHRTLAQRRSVPKNDRQPNAIVFVCGRRSSKNTKALIDFTAAPSLPRGGGQTMSSRQSTRDDHLSSACARALVGHRRGGAGRLLEIARRNISLRPVALVPS